MITPPATIGMLGGGQLGRYFVVAARTMGFRTMVLEPDPTSPAGAVADVHLVAAYDDTEALEHMAGTCAVITTEFENPPATALAKLAATTIVRPPPRAIAIAQDRAIEKEFLDGIDVPVAPWASLSGESTVPGDFAFPAILKTARMGYDGKGQIAVERAQELDDAWHQLGAVPCVLEQRIDFDGELSVIVARSADGTMGNYAPTENSHRNGILDVSIAPTAAPGAVELARRIADSLDYVGVLAVEMFTNGGKLIVNEIAPRPHNSGHWTLDVSHTSQFEQQLRAVCGLPLGPTAMTAPVAAMINVLGDAWAAGEPDWSAVLAEPTATLHLYGKTEPRPGRKMGHITVTADTHDEAEGAVARIRAILSSR